MPEEAECYFELQDVGGGVYGGPVGTGRPCQWRLVGPNGVIATSEVLADRESALSAIEWVRKHVADFELRDMPVGASAVRSSG